MLSVEKKINAEIKRLQNTIFEACREIGGWKAKRGYYKAPGTYEMLDEEWRDFPAGQRISEREVTVFLKNKIILDESLKGKKVVLLLKAGGEGCLFVNGVPYHGLDFNRNMVLLTESANGDEVYELEIETYCKVMTVNGEDGFGEITMEVELTQTGLAAVNEEAWDCYFEMKTAYDFICGCKEAYTRGKVLKLLYESLLQLDYSGTDGGNESFTAAKEYYREKIAPYGRIKIPETVHFAGHSHMDVAWVWPLKETVRKVSRTFSSMLRLMEQYREFTFSQSQPVLYEMAEKYYPILFEQIKERVREGRWETLGSMYLEPDCNLIGGESMVRQILYGKQFWKQKMGSDSRVCFLPDVFGFPASMPQILKKAGTDYFFTSKLTWNETNEFPYSVFQWRGLDGTEVLSGMMSMCTKNGLDIYNGDGSAGGIQMSLDLFKNKENTDSVLYLYGYGDGGGGVTKEMLETLTRCDKVPMTPGVKMGTVQQYFEGLRQEGEYPVWSGDLYFEKHRGTYTTAANNKKNNRKSEFLYRDAEIASVFQYLENGNFLKDEVREGWKWLLLNQFHDILPGTSICEVYEKSDEQYEYIRETGENSIRENLNKMGLPSRNTVTVYNTLSWERSEVVEIAGQKGKGFKREDGVYPIQVQKEDGRILFLAENVPPMGRQVYELTNVIPDTGSLWKADLQETEEGFLIRTPGLQVMVGKNGELVSLYDAENDREVLQEGRRGNRLKLLEDIPVEWGSAWETTTKREDRPSLEAVDPECRIKEHNPLYTVVETGRTMHRSRITQDIVIYNHKPLIAFKTTVDWRERHKILRVEFPVNVHSQTARVDIAFGNTEHPNHATTGYDAARFEVCGHKWGDVSEGGYGVALLNDCKYGYSIRNSNIELSLLRSADYPSDSCDRGIHSFTYCLYPHTGGIREGRVAQMGYEVNAGLLVRNTKPTGPVRSWFQIDSSNVVLDTVKRAEDGEGIILRCYETYNTRSPVNLRFAFPVKKCTETDLLERELKEIPVRDKTVAFTMNPYEIKTFRIRVSSGRGSN